MSDPIIIEYEAKIKNLKDDIEILENDLLLYNGKKYRDAYPVGVFHFKHSPDFKSFELAWGGKKIKDCRYVSEQNGKKTELNNTPQRLRNFQGTVLSFSSYNDLIDEAEKHVKPETIERFDKLLTKLEKYNQLIIIKNLNEEIAKNNLYALIYGDYQIQIMYKNDIPTSYDVIKQCKFEDLQEEILKIIESNS